MNSVLTRLLFAGAVFVVLLALAQLAGLANLGVS